jgi:uncharacterized membrane protein
VILGLPFLLLFPGYALVAALFPRKSAIGAVERLALSFALSIAVVVLIGLILNYTPWGIKVNPILACVAGLTLGVDAFAVYRRHRLPDEERFSISFDVKLRRWATLNKWDKALSVMLVISICALGAVGTIAYRIVTPKQTDKFTEFYILGLEGRAEGYPTELTVGEEVKVVLAIVNHEYVDNVAYSVKILINGEENKTIGLIHLNNGEKWEETVGFIPKDAGEHEKVEFLLFKSGEAEPYSSLHIWINVISTA